MSSSRPAHARLAPEVAGGSTLDWLLAPRTREEFFGEIWERGPLVVRRGQPGYFERLFSLDEADRVLTTLDRRFPDITLKDARRELSGDDYTFDDDRLDVARVFALFDTGATIMMAYLDEVVPALGELCRGLEAEFSCPCQSNIYLTPPNAQGAKAHYDTHDVFVLQIAGSKHWTLFGTPIESPLAGQEFDPARDALGPVSLEFELAPGDVAYLPRGLAHEAQASGEVSLHITAGVLRTTWADLLFEALAGACLRDAALRKALPPGFARPDFDRRAAAGALRELWRRAEPHLEAEAALELFASRLEAARPPSWRGQLAQLQAARGLQPASWLAWRPGLAPRCQTRADGGLTLEIPGRAITVPAAAARAARFALAQPRFRPRDLPGLDPGGQLTLARRLVREGLLVVV